MDKKPQQATNGATLYVVKYADGSYAGWTMRTKYIPCRRYFKTEATALAYDKETSPGYPGVVEQVK